MGMAYQRKLEPGVKGYCEHVLRNYHREIIELNRAKNDLIPSYTTSMTPTAGIHGGGQSRTTEQTVLLIAGDPYIQGLERRVKAVEQVLETSDTIDKSLLASVYWRRERNVEGTAALLEISKSVAYDRLNKILVSLAINLGLVKKVA